MPPHLKTYNPSSTTVQFTVSNAAPRSTIASKIIFYVGIIIRIVIFASVILVDTATCRNHIPDSWTAIPWDTIWTSSIGLIACNIADAYMWQGIAACSALLLYFVVRKGYTGLFPYHSIQRAARTLMMVERGIFACHSRPGSTDIDVFCDLFPQCDN